MNDNEAFQAVLLRLCRYINWTLAVQRPDIQISNAAQVCMAGSCVTLAIAYVVASVTHVAHLKVVYNGVEWKVIRSTGELLASVAGTEELSGYTALLETIDGL